MTLKNSFLIDLCENMKRRNWVFWLSFLTFFCYFPGYLVLALNNLRTNYGGREETDLLRMQELMSETVEELFCLNGFMPVLIIGIATLIGMQGFVYLHNKRQVDFYHSQPVSRKRRFMVFWLNGIVVFLATYLINMILGMIVAVAFGTMNGAVFLAVIKAFLMYLLLFLGIYHISIIAVLLTGNTLVSLLAMMVMLGYEMAMRAMVVLMADSFFLTYGNEGEEKIFDTLLSPIVTIYKYILLGGRQQEYWQYANKNYTYLSTSLVLCIMAVVFGAVGFFLYKKRASESHGNSISFPKIKEVLRFALLLAFGSFGTYFIYYVAGENVAIGIAGSVFFVVLGHAVIQLIYEVDFRAIRKRWITAAISLVTVILIFLGYRYDWIGYDNRVPKQAKVESVYVSLAAEGFGNNNYVLTDGTEIYQDSYKKKEMKITDLDIIYELLEKRENVSRNIEEFNGTYHTIEFIFRMKNRDIQHRRLYFQYEENMELLDKIYHMKEYQLPNNQVLENNFVDNYRIVSLFYHDGLYEKEILDMDISSVIEAYKKDLENASYEEVYDSIPLGKIRLSGIGLQSEEYRNSWDILIYESYKNTIGLLEEVGIFRKTVFDEAYINSIQKIEVSFEDYEKMEQFGMLWEDCRKTGIYTDKEMYGQILENAIPDVNRWWGNNNVYDSEGYTVLVYTNNPYNVDDFYCYEIFFRNNSIPQFIKDDLEKIQFGEEEIIL